MLFTQQVFHLEYLFFFYLLLKHETYYFVSSLSLVLFIENVLNLFQYVNALRIKKASNTAYIYIYIYIYIC